MKTHIEIREEIQFQDEQVLKHKKLADACDKCGAELSREQHLNIANKHAARKQALECVID
jgi:hypothetical protein